MIVVFAAVAAVRLTPALSWVALLLGVPAMVFAVLEAVQPDTDWIVLTSAAVHAPFYFYVSYAMIRYLFHDDRVTRDELFATGAAFTVVAWAFAYVYAAAQVIWPGSFVGADGDDQEWFSLLFLSFTNLTSVGLSDVAAGRRARSLAGDDRAGRGRALRRAGDRPAGRASPSCGPPPGGTTEPQPNSLAISPLAPDLGLLGRRRSGRGRPPPRGSRRPASGRSRPPAGRGELRAPDQVRERLARPGASPRP